MDTNQARDLLLGELPRLDRIVASVCRRAGLEGSEAEDFASAVRMKLIENDYDLIRRFEERSSFSTWLMVVVQRHLLDYRNHLWGKWRPSAEAERIGEHAVLLERLVQRDGMPLEQACRTVRAETRTRMTDEELAAVIDNLPVRRIRPRVEPLDDSAAHRDERPTPEDLLLEADAERLGAETSRILRERLVRLAPEDRLLIRMRFRDGLPVAQIARATGTNQRQLYYRLERIAATLRGELERAGVDRGRARELLERGPRSFDLGFDEKAVLHPSTENEGADAAAAEARE